MVVPLSRRLMPNSFDLDGVMAALDPAVHALSIAQEDVDAQVKPAHDDRDCCPSHHSG
jgi:hypothetical protein